MLLGVIDPLLKAAAPLLVVFAYSTVTTRETFAFFPANAPFVVQLILATLLIELGRYWAHRLHHTNRFLWWLHAMHHSSERLYAVNNFRFHPLNYVVNFALSTFPLMLVGVPADVLFGYMALTQPVLMLQHANINLRSGWLNYVLSTNELHRWHHSSDANEADSNYGSALVIWDHVFGTFKFPRNNQTPKRLGLFEQSANYPARASYLQQLLSAFGPSCCRA
jgi:ornithine lipid hydroxylase